MRTQSPRRCGQFIGLTLGAMSTLALARPPVDPIDSTAEAARGVFLATGVAARRSSGQTA